MKKQKFNLAKLAKAILAKRVKDNLNFRQITKDTKGALPHSTLHRIEGQQTNPSAEILADICNWLEVEVQTFFS